ncbi:hypothetical protein AB1Y20_000671 [Prymnesium parvum]|uniref:Histone-lysine N-methyltransferase, H3 lysine-79 specific n=1 Tax=Prymnesium parvum TaxID=97485 RepID=A0AB34KAQ9_PRYPA
MLQLAPSLATALLSIAGPRAPTVRCGANIAQTSWIDAFLEDSTFRAARWEQAQAARDDIVSTARESDGLSAEATALTYGEFDVRCFHSLLQHALTLCGRDPSALTFCDLGSGAGCLVLSAAAAWPFRQCIGLELLRPLHDLAIEIHEAACQLSEKLDEQLAPCGFKQVDLTDVQAAEHALADVDIAFAFSTCFDDAYFASSLRKSLPQGALLVSIDALMPNCELDCEPSASSSPSYFHLIDKSTVPWNVCNCEEGATDDRDSLESTQLSGHTAYFWRLLPERPQISIDFAVLQK